MFLINDAYASQQDTITIKEAEQLPAAPEPMQSGWMSMVPMILIFVVFYFLLIRPQEKRRKEQESLVKGVKIGEKILTAGGIFGTVIKVNDSDNTVEVEIAPNTVIKMLKTSIGDIVSRKKVEESTKVKEKGKTV